MQSSLDFPFDYLEHYLTDKIYDDLNKFYMQYENEYFGPRILKIDKKLHIVEIQRDIVINNELDYDTFTFENWVNTKISHELLKIKHFIELGFLNRFDNKTLVQGYADFLKIKIRHILCAKALTDFPFLNNYIDKIEETINRFSKETISNDFIFSFNFLPKGGEDQMTKIEKLYSLLMDTPAMINCTKEEFFNAFTGKQVKNKIQWLAKSKRNKRTSKTALLYFLDELINNNYLSRGIALDLYKFIRYVFVDDSGNELKNLKNSRQNMSKHPDFKDRINNIITSL